MARQTYRIEVECSGSAGTFTGTFPTADLVYVEVGEDGGFVRKFLEAVAESDQNPRRIVIERVEE